MNTTGCRYLANSNERELALVTCSSVMSCVSSAILQLHLSFQAENDDKNTASQIAFISFYRSRQFLQYRQDYFSFQQDVMLSSFYMLYLPQKALTYTTCTSMMRFFYTCHYLQLLCIVYLTCFFFFILTPTVYYKLFLYQNKICNK